MTPEGDAAFSAALDKATHRNERLVRDCGSNGSSLCQPAGIREVSVSRIIARLDDIGQAAFEFPESGPGHVVAG